MAAVLGSWKEIAQYLGKGVRTVQRWEHELQLPVHRPEAANKGVVIAFPGELDKWARRHAGNGAARHDGRGRREELDRMCQYSSLLIERTQLLRKNLERLQAECERACTSALRRNKVNNHTQL
ncbi:MAG: hypothetical protein JO041_09225 [Acidobacteria bacterium]|nr:hypothetical protein [Acidobacteriota bacterium]